jgi:hypothetical protein
MPAIRQKITFAELRSQGVRGLLVFCLDYRCSHSIKISATNEYSRIATLGNSRRPKFRLDE